MLINKIVALICLLVGQELYGSYQLAPSNNLNFIVNPSMPQNRLITGWSYVSLDEMSELDFPVYGSEVADMVPNNKQRKAKVVAYKVAARIALPIAMVNRELITSQRFLARANGIEFVAGTEQNTTFGKKFQGYVSLPMNRTLLDLEVNFIDLQRDLAKPGLQAMVDLFAQGDDQLPAPDKIIVSRARDLKNGGYLHGMYNVFKVFDLAKSEVLLVMYTFSVVDGGNMLVRFAGGEKVKSSLDESTLSFVEELASLAP